MPDDDDDRLKLTALDMRDEQHAWALARIAMEALVTHMAKREQLPERQWIRTHRLVHVAQFRMEGQRAGILHSLEIEEAIGGEPS